MKEPIIVYEHESLRVNEKGFTYDHLKSLSKFLGNKGEDDFPYYSLINNGVKFRHYVGVISVGNIQIEVLPKADRKVKKGEEEMNENDEKHLWEEHLLEMLRVVYKLKVSRSTKADQQIKHSRVLDVFLNHFMDEVEHIMHVGLVKAYRRVEDNRTSLKGRLIMSKHIVKNLVHQERFYVDYTTYDRNHILNRLLYKTLRVIQDITASNDIILRAKTLMFEFPELNDIVISEALFNRLNFDRKTEDYRYAIDLVRMILLNYMPNMTYNRNNNVVALMFDMNKLWEEYVYITLRRQLTDYTVLAQNIKEFWRSDSNKIGEKTIRPDIVIKKGDTCVAVLDTKWKIPQDGKPSDSDLKQMYVYHKYWETNYTALLYPGDYDKVEGHFIGNKGELEDPAKCCMFFLPISDNHVYFLGTNKLIEDLKTL